MIIRRQHCPLGMLVALCLTKCPLNGKQALIPRLVCPLEGFFSVTSVLLRSP